MNTPDETAKEGSPDSDVELAIATELADEVAHSIGELASVVGQPEARVKDRLESMRAERRAWESPVAPDRWMRIPYPETVDHWTARMQAYANHYGLYLKEDGPEGQGGGWWLARIGDDGSAPTDRDDWFGPYTTRERVEERVPQISVGDKGSEEA